MFFPLTQSHISLPSAFWMPKIGTKTKNKSNENSMLFSSKSPHTWTDEHRAVESEKRILMNFPTAPTQAALSVKCQGKKSTRKFVRRFISFENWISSFNIHVAKQKKSFNNALGKFHFIVDVVPSRPSHPIILFSSYLSPALCSAQF